MRNLSVRYAWLLILFGTLAGVATAQDVASLYSLSGEAKVKKARTEDWVPVTTDSRFVVGDVLRTGAATRAGILFVDGSLVRLSETTELAFKAPVAADPAVELTSGRAYYFNRTAEAHPHLDTPMVSGSVRGTEFAVEVTKNQAVFTVINGEVELKNGAGFLRLRGGEQGITEPGAAPRRKIFVNPTDAVQWALYFPSSLFLGTEISPNVAQSIKKLEAGQLEAAERELTLSGSGAEVAVVQSLRAIIAVVKNDRDQANSAMVKALAVAPHDVAVLVAASFVAQSNFDLPAARNFAAEALTLKRCGATLLRSAELELGFGAVAEAQKLSDEALQLEPSSAAALTMRGFVELIDNRAQDAQGSFGQAVLADPNQGSSHLGLGLALIKLGDLDTGTRELQKAVHLEPSVASYRAYLGKAFFEAEQSELADGEFREALRLDPNDPTTYLYRAYNRLSTFRPVEALWDVEDAMNRNGQRAVYRSSLLLDQDAATRSAGLSQVYSSLGFSELARVTASRSLQRDYSNYSSHLLLGSSYQSSGPAFSQASLSENLTGSLLAPVNFNALLPATGGQAGLNEYTALFERPTTRSQVAGYLNSADDRVETDIRSLGSSRWASYFLRYENVLADGYRDNDFTRRNIVRGLSQLRLSTEDTGLVDISFGSLDQGDTFQNLNPHENDADFSLELTDFTGRLGWHHQGGVGVHTLAQVIGIDTRLDTKDAGLERFIGVNLLEADGALVELADQALVSERSRQRSRGVRADVVEIVDGELVSFVAGTSLLDLTSKTSERSVVERDELAIFEGQHLSSSAQTAERSSDSFVWSTWHLGETMDLNAGVTYSYSQFGVTQIPPYRDVEDARARWNPKIGLSADLSSAATVSLAYYENLGGASLRDLESLEPAQVAGFNQTFESAPGDRARTLAARFDYKAAKSTYVGAEVSERGVISDANFTAPFLTIDSSNGETIADQIFEHYDRHVQEHEVRGYLYQIVSPRVVATGEYSWFQLDDDFYEVQTRSHRGGVGATYFATTGLYIQGRATWRHQSRSGFGELVLEGPSDFWMVDVGVGYQLKKRGGALKLKVENLLDQDFSYLSSSREGLIFPGLGVSLSYSLDY